MQPTFENGNVKAFCPDCKAVTSFEYHTGGSEFGTIIIDGHHYYKGGGYARLLYKLLRCAGCQKGGIAKLHLNNSYTGAVLEEFYPASISELPIPNNVPDNIKKEFHEAEICASLKAFRAASAMIRSTLEKTLKINGYIDGTLQSKIDAACEEGVITGSRKERAHEDIRVLGNDILHEEWKEVIDEEYEKSHRYMQRILEDFYDDRLTVESFLKKANRII